MSTAPTKTQEAAAAKKPAMLTYVLQYPVSYGGEDYTEIDYRRPKGSDMRQWMNGREGAGDDIRKLMSNLAELPEKFFDELDGEDFMALSDAMSDFLPKPRRT